MPPCPRRPDAVRTNKRINGISRREAAWGPFCWASLASGRSNAPSGGCGEGRDAGRGWSREGPGIALRAARRHRTRLVRAIMEHFKHKSVKNRAELSPPRGSAVP